MTHQVWSIGFASASSLPELQAGVSERPILTAADITDVKADFVADPFLIHHGEAWHLFLKSGITTPIRGKSVSP
jgi:hypothetical protein